MSEHGRTRVLLVDDDVRIGRALGLALGDEGVDVDAVHTGEQALVVALDEISLVRATVVREEAGAEEVRHVGDGVGERGGFLERLREGTWAAHILEHVVIELHGMAGVPEGFDVDMLLELLVPEFDLGTEATAKFPYPGSPEFILGICNSLQLSLAGVNHLNALVDPVVITILGPGDCRAAHDQENQQYADHEGIPSRCWRAGSHCKRMLSVIRCSGIRWRIL